MAIALRNRPPRGREPPRRRPVSCNRPQMVGLQHRELCPEVSGDLCRLLMKGAGAYCLLTSALLVGA